ncbi:hypothetical protein METBIDRAFT_43268 [Metschnikowia bicuspidata var. bicuspidata NRRL YB-4993]|uniref:SART-1 protein n=1 Tax=Metschnikowia bicuspidata var. bicuspidata NRRL YB-4993 TaxID=869754 RepID=A0A1A0H9C9_9ASCO|nr:hypothetical protein METBIDRAFT_43268 [Metschnikowia bicuspidata var. bicuspidata NRRL YB-4993]OBA20492.1 hypothetical protein METBIDRAFT_43268 [Metschnikowia bicuspidata var. bicuspidata NRRL YB-4993]
MAGPIELSIEETNKLRAQLGLPLIPTSALSTDENSSNKAASRKESESGCDLRPPRHDLDVAGPGDLHPLESKHSYGSGDPAPSSKETDQLNRDTLHRPKQPRILFQYDEVDTDSWLDSLGGSRGPVQQAQAVQTTARELEVEAGHTTVKHTTKQLALLADGEVFTLADAGVLEDTGDELMNENLTRDAKLAHSQNSKHSEARIKLGKSNVLDESADEKSDDHEQELAVLEGTTILLAPRKVDEAANNSEPAGNVVRFDNFLDSFEPSKPSVPMKKLKKKLKGISKKRQRNEDSIDVDEPMYTARLDLEDELDDTFEDVLRRTRVKRNKARKLLTAEEIANEVKLHQRVDMVAEADSGLVYDDTKDFLDALGARLNEAQSAVSNLVEGSTKEATEIEPNRKLDADPAVSANHETKPLEATKTSNINLELAPGSELAAQELEASQSLRSTEPNLSSILSTLKYLRSRPDALSPEVTKTSKAYREHQREAELAKIQINIEERLLREQMNKDPIFLKMKTDEQEKVIERKLNDQLVQKGIVSEVKKGGKYARYSNSADPLEDYSPQVSVEYKDARGNKLDSKQAWKELLHKYHGLAPKHKKDTPSRKSTEEKVIH